MKLAAFSLLILTTLSGAATPLQSKQDVKGSTDHPLFPNRMPGYTIMTYQTEAFSSRSFHTRPPQTIEGKYTWIRYYLQDPNQHPGGLAIHRNYQNAIKSVGGQVLPASHSDFSVLKVTREGVEVWVEVSANYQRDYSLHIIERVPMQQVIKADGLAAALDKDGFIALDIHFATGKAEILPESRPIIDEIVSLMKKRPNLRIGVEGHTDNTGTPATNKTLSDARAKAVVAAIVAAGISSNRLEPVGYDRSARLLTTGTRRAGRRIVAWSL